MFFGVLAVAPNLSLCCHVLHHLHEGHLPYDLNKASSIETTIDHWLIVK